MAIDSRNVRAAFLIYVVAKKKRTESSCTLEERIVSAGVNPTSPVERLTYLE